MKKLTILALSSIVAFGISGPVFADSANWDADKASQIEDNRNSNAGIGNGGEKQKKNGDWTATKNGEDGGQDVDPGNSGDHNQACSGGGAPADTDC